MRANMWCWAVALAILTSSPSASPANAQCSNELTAVLLVSGIYPGTDMQIQKLNVSPVGALTYPSADQLLAAVQAVYAGWSYPLHHVLKATVGNYNLYWHIPDDGGAATIVDVRTGQVVFGASVWWLGTGSVFVPATDTGSCRLVPGEPAGPPASLAALPSTFWYWGTPEQVAQTALGYAQQTDVLHSFASCGDYSVVGFTWTPFAGIQDMAGEVLIVSGRADVTWVPVPAEAASWGQLKTLYR
jgi:hypothetical protein